jgi:hypothetical protein
MMTTQERILKLLSALPCHTWVIAADKQMLRDFSVARDYRHVTVANDANGKPVAQLTATGEQLLDRMKSSVGIAA